MSDSLPHPQQEQPSSQHLDDNERPGTSHEPTTGSSTRGHEAVAYIDRQADQANDNHQSEREPVVNFPFDENIFDSAAQAPITHHQDEETSYIQPATGGLVHPEDFRPFFTLIQDRDTGAYHHPTVHYIFSDDDPEILTSALLETLDESHEQYTQSGRPSSPPLKRTVIVDVAADGKTITSTASPSPAWQGLETVVGPAPSWGSDTSDADRGLMMTITARQGTSDFGVGGAAQRSGQYASVEEMLETFGQRLAQLDNTFSKTT